MGGVDPLEKKGGKQCSQLIITCAHISHGMASSHLQGVIIKTSNIKKTLEIQSSNKFQIKYKYDGVAASVFLCVCVAVQIVFCDCCASLRPLAPTLWSWHGKRSGETLRPV